MRNANWVLMLVAAIIAALVAFGGLNPWVPALGLLTGVLARFVIWPIEAKRSRGIAVGRVYRPVNPAGDEMTADARAAFRRVEDGLKPLGFDLVAVLSLLGRVVNVDGFLGLYRNAKTKEAARFVLTVATGPGTRRTSRVLAYITTFGDGTEVSTANRKSVRPVPAQGPPIVAYNIPQADDAAELLAIHRALVDRSDGGRIRVDPVGDDPLGYQEAIEHRQTEYLETRGLFRLHAEAREIRPTWRGAVLVTWRLLWPLNPLLLAAERRAGARLVRSVRAGQPDR